MLDKRKFTISIGEYGTIIALHNGNNVENKILIASLNEENTLQLTDLFTKNKSASTYILIDYADQNYKRKSYPLATKADFNKIVKRDLEKEIDSKDKSFQSYYGVKDKAQNKWDCIFVSAPQSSETEQWVEFLLRLPNDFIGIYMLPIETYNLAHSVFELAKIEHKIVTNENSVLSFVVQNKISGVRQIVFYNQTIVFTRVVSYDFDDGDFAAKFEQDVFRANEYLKMIFPKLKAQDVTIINILSEEIVEKIQNVSNHDFNFLNYSPRQITSKLGLTNITAKNNSNFSDIIIANSFANNRKKILKFTNPHIIFLSRLGIANRAGTIINLATIFGIFIIIVKVILQSHNYNNLMLELKNQKAQLSQKIQSIRNAALDLETKDGDKSATTNNDLANAIIDFGKIDEVLSKVNVNIADVFNRLTFIKKYDALATSFSYQIPNYNPKSESFHIVSKFSISGNLSDASGDVEVLLGKFDNLNLETKNKFPEYNIKYSEISKNIDFGKKYYSFPFDLTIENKAP